MPVPNSIDDLDPVASNNSPSGSDPPTDGDNHIRALAAIIRQEHEATASLAELASSGTASVGAGLVGYDSDLAYPAGTVGHRLAQELSAKDAQFGAVGDGVTDDAIALQAAITAAAGDSLFVPEGHYICDAQLSIPSDTRLRGAGKGKTILDFTDAVAGGAGAFSASALYCDGTLGSEVAATVSLAIGSTSVLCDAAHGAVADDWILLTGDTATAANDCLDAAAGANQLGDDTQVVPFAELIQVDSVSGDTINFRGANRFPYTTKLFVQKVTPAANIEIEGITFIFGANLPYTRFRRGHKLSIRNCAFRSEGAMRGARLEMCWQSEVVNNDFDFDAAANTSASTATEYNGVNLFNGCAWVRVAGNRIVNPTQGVDVTYNDNAASQPAPCREIDIEDNTIIGASYHAITTHTGSTDVRIRRNTISRCLTGIYGRCRNMDIDDNSISVTGEGSPSYGVWLGDNGYYIGTNVRRNRIVGAGVGIQLAGTSTPFARRDVSIEDNHVEALVGLDASSTGATTEQSNLAILRNRFVAASGATQYIEIEDDNNGVLIRGNVCRGAVSVRGIRVSAPCAGPEISDNIVIDAGGAIVPFAIDNSVTGWVFSGNRLLGTNGVSSLPNAASSLPLGSNNTFNWSAYIADDAATSFALPSNHCMVVLSCFRGAGNGIAFMQSGSAGTKIGGHANFAATTGVLAGTTGSDGNVTVSIDSSTLYIENRSGNTDTFGVLVIASAA